MASVLDNPYKLQFFPEFEAQVSSATMYHIPIVNGQYLQACLDEKKILDIAPFLITGVFHPSSIHAI
jgi:hypothetical protein